MRTPSLILLALLAVSGMGFVPNTKGGGGGGGSPSACADIESPIDTDQAGPIGSCERLADADGDGDVGDDFQRIINAGLFPGGVVSAGVPVYIEAPPPGVYMWSTQAVICPDTTPPAAGSSTPPDCTGAAGDVSVPINFIGDWSRVTFACNVVAALAATRRGCLSIGDAQTRAGAAADGYRPNLRDDVDTVASGEIELNMPTTMRWRIVYDSDYPVSGLAVAPEPFELLGATGLIDFYVEEQGSDSYKLSDQSGGDPYAIRVMGQGLTGKLDVRTTDYTYDNATDRFAIDFGGPGTGNNFIVKGYNIQLRQRDKCLSTTGCGNVRYDVDITNRANMGDAFNFTQWDSPTIVGRCTQYESGVVTHSSCLEFAPDDSPTVSPMKSAHIGPMDLDCAESSRGCLTLKSCSATESPVFTVSDVSIKVRDAVGVDAGGISARKESSSSCSLGHGEGEMPPIVKVSGYSFDSESGSGYYAFAEDAGNAGSSDNDGLIISEAGRTYQWFTNDVADVAAGECLNFAMDSDGTDMHLPCTDERTMLRPVDSNLFVAWSRVDIGNDAIDAGEGCKLTPNYNGSDDADTDHILLSGDDANVEAVDTGASAYINRVVTAGQTLQFKLEDAAADNCTDHVGVRWSAHIIPIASPLINDAPFGDAQP